MDELCLRGLRHAGANPVKCTCLSSWKDRSRLWPTEIPRCIRLKPCYELDAWPWATMMEHARARGLAGSSLRVFANLGVLVEIGNS